MCGILGGNNPDWDYQRGIEAMKHRGPDDMRISHMDDFHLAFARLAIMDLSANGMQPMFSDDGNVGLVYNGEIYGFQKLRRRLEDLGCSFRSTSDTEVILNAYLQWGERFITQIDGMYGMAVYDKRDGTVKLFRDRIGIKPLYYFYDGYHFAFSSELKGIEKLCSNISFRTDDTAVYDYLNYLYIPDPKTLYHNVYKLRAGHRLVFDIKKRKIVKDNAYWKLEINDRCGRQRKTEDIICELKELIAESVREQMVADVPVGTFLSGGIDSSIITYESSRINKNVETFSIGFTDSNCNETKYAVKVADKLGVPANVRIFNHGIYKKIYNQMKVWYDEPFADTSAFPTYLVSGEARDKVTVALTGDGGDELFGGYPRYELFLNKEKRGTDNLLVSFLYRNLRPGYASDSKWLDNMLFLSYRYAFPLCKTDREIRKALNIPGDYDRAWLIRKYYIKDLPPRTRTQFIDLKTYLPGDILTKVDRTSMAVSLETRVPFLNKKIVAFAFSLSEEDRYLNGELKGLLKRAYLEELGKEVMHRRKMGFSIPSSYYCKELSPQEELLEKVWNMGKGKGLT